MTDLRLVVAASSKVSCLALVLSCLVPLAAGTEAGVIKYKAAVDVNVKGFSYSSIRFSFRMELFTVFDNLTLAFIQPNVATGDFSSIDRMSYVFSRGETTSANTTIYFVESDFDLNWNKRPFPEDEFNATYYVALSLPLRTEGSFRSTTTAGSPNFDAYWKLEQVADQLQSITFQPVREDLREMKAWFRLYIRIWHNDSFKAYAKIFTEITPWLFIILYFLLCFLIFVPIGKEIRQSRGLSRHLESARNIERILIPVCASVIVFFPLYNLAVHSLAAPLPYIHADFMITTLLLWYVVALSVGVALRVAVSCLEMRHDRE